MRIHVSAVNRVQEIRKDFENFSKRQPSLEFRLPTNALLVCFENYQRVKKVPTENTKVKDTCHSPVKKKPPIIILDIRII